MSTIKEYDPLNMDMNFQKFIEDLQKKEQAYKTNIAQHQESPMLQYKKRYCTTVKRKEK